MMRFKTFWRAAGPVQSVMFCVVMAIFTLGCAAALAKGRYADPILMFPGCFLVAWLFRDLLIRFARPIMRTMQVVWVMMIVSAFLRPAAGWFPGDEWVIFPALGLYLGAYFWMMSDLRVLLAMVLR